MNFADVDPLKSNTVGLDVINRYGSVGVDRVMVGALRHSGLQHGAQDDKDGTSSEGINTGRDKDRDRLGFVGAISMALATKVHARGPLYLEYVRDSEDSVTFWGIRDSLGIGY